ncbi:Fcf1-domain-containing protein [Boletus edulis]|uniref:U three protein 23 n=1 Tax=Boletus edulis BED1 TaxID=1328754 RepID=A0AAD4GIP7_BOLED|nr:Fcf1-domain-containing protein [Boletus edulis]KAF8446112.1 PIN domain-like protein [Boletus edulis BED1]
MRQRRAKTYRKLMSLYSLSFGFRQPYQVLIDSDMCILAVAAKTDLHQQLGIVLQGNVKPMITQCCIQELYLLGKSHQSAVDLAKSFERRKCNHREAIPGQECIASVIGESNKHRYVVATQLRALRVMLRLIPAVPIVHRNRAVMILEPPSDATLDTKQQNEEKAFQPSAAELANIGVDNPPERPRRRKGPKGPNSLSVKKKAPPDTSQKRKRTDVDEDVTSPTAQKRKRRRKRGDSSATLSNRVSPAVSPTHVST